MTLQEELERMEDFFRKREYLGFNDTERKLLISAYLSHKPYPWTDDEKIEVLRAKMGWGFIPDHFDKKEQERKAYEFVYLGEMHANQLVTAAP